MADAPKFTLRRTAHAVGAVAGILIAGAVVLLWSWNGFAVEILQAPALRFRHAFALELLLLSVAAAPVLALRLARSPRHGSAHP